MLHRHRMLSVCIGCVVLVLLAITGCQTVQNNRITPIAETMTVTAIPFVSPTPPTTAPTPTVTAPDRQALCISEIGNWVEQEHTITCSSYWNPAAREALDNDPKSRINAAYLDLETGDTAEILADISYQLSCGSMCFPRWRGMEGVIVEDTTSTKQPTIEQCEELLLRGKTLTVPHQSFSGGYGYYYCVLTREGRVGWIHYDDDFRSGLSGSQSQITYWVWDITIPEKSK